uniref:Very long-chain fatty acid transport protein n=1 Tax=Lygus hesperus TaxID=30085 RepID=A0A146LRJ0_LYGHE
MISWLLDLLQPQLNVILLGFVAVLLVHNGAWLKIYRALVTLPRDLHLFMTAAHMMVEQKYWEYKKIIPATIFLNFVKKHPNKIAFRTQDDSWTFQQAEDWSNQVANYFKSKGVKKGDCVALFSEGRVEYPCIWLGLSKIGAISALINTSQTGTVLQRCIEISSAKWLIYSTDLANAVEEIEEELSGLTKFHLGSGKSLKNSTSLEKAVSSSSKNSPQDDIKKLTMFDSFMYIYTSGTTGMPKAAIMTHARFIMMAMGVKRVLGVTEDDVMYTSLPLYHTAGGLLGCGQVILGGSTQFIRSKFSASNFFKDCIKYDCTVAQYIGEICRYLLTTPAAPTDKQHKVRLMFGNGLRPQVWREFVSRFNVKQIGEFYGATEGNSSTVNGWNRVGSVGYIPWFLKPLYPVELIRVNEETKEPIRGEDGLCIPCKPGEAGLLISKILKARAVSHFNGYVDKDATQKKILRDVLKKGDSAFNSGDILVCDEYGYLYFKDRTGDTFRWRGENVATSEVEGIISKVVGNVDATVYGVEIPNVEGKAGMATVVDKENKINLDELAQGIKKLLPPFARPLFLRLVRDIPLTGTFKIQKVEFQKEGFDPSVISDPLYFYNDKQNKFLPLDQNLYNDIVNNVVSL